MLLFTFFFHFSVRKFRLQETEEKCWCLCLIFIWTRILYGMVPYTKHFSIFLWAEEKLPSIRCMYSHTLYTFIYLYNRVYTYKYTSIYIHTYIHIGPYRFITRITLKCTNMYSFFIRYKITIFRFSKYC